MKTILWMVVGTLLSCLGLSEFGLLMAKGYTDISGPNWFWKMMCIYSFCGILTSPIPFVIGSSGFSRRNNFYGKIGARVSLVFGGWSLVVFVWAIANGGGLF
jgi:hypothetical protein